MHKFSFIIQINTVFDSEYVHIQNQHGYNRISQYYFQPGEYDSNDDNEDNNDASNDGGDNNVRNDGAPMCPFTAYEKAPTLHTHLIWMWDAVSGGYQPQS